MVESELDLRSELTHTEQSYPPRKKTAELVNVGSKKS